MRRKRLPRKPYLDFREPAALMREYFRNARVVYSEARRALDWNEKSESSLAAQFRDWRSRLSNTEFTVSNDRVLSAIARAVDQRSRRHLALARIRRAPRHAVGRGNRAPSGTRARQLSPRYCASPAQPLWPALRNILSLPHADTALRAMHDTGLLQAMFPEWNTISCLVVPDFYHRYTVDEHTLVAIEKLAGLAPAPKRTRRGGVSPTFYSEIEDLALLRFALLIPRLRQRGAQRRPRASLGGTGANRDAAHSNAGRRIRSAVEFLIEHHLDLSAVMNSRDLHDPATAPHAGRSASARWNA